MSAEDFSTLTQMSPALTNERLSGGLTKWFGEPVNFSHWEYVGETGKGDSYLSDVLRVKIHGTNQKGENKYVQVVIKTIPKNVCRRLTYRSHDFFKNEITFYEKVLPALLKFQATKELKDPFNNYTKLFLCFSDGLNDFISLEDAGLENFGSAVRQEGIDYEHCQQSFKALAKFHAISFAMRDQEQKDFDVISNEIFETYYADHLWDWYERFWKRISGIAIDAVEKEYPNSIYVKKIKEFAVPERYKDMVKAVTSTFKTGVISHGDCWTSNFLYKYVDGKPVNAKLIDFQLTRCASPVLDVAFFIYACTSQELRLKHYDVLLRYYYEVLSTQIKEMGSDPDKLYSWKTFNEEVHKFSYFGLAFSFESTPFIVLAPEDAINMEMEGDQKKNIDDFWQLPLLKTKESRLREANNVVHCVDNGYI